MILTRAVLLPLILGWLVAGLLAYGYVQGRAADIRAANAANPDKPALDPDTPLRDEVLRGPFLLSVQVGVVCAALVWQASAAARRCGPRAGIGVGLLVALIQSGVAYALGSPPLFIIPLFLLIFGAGVYGSYVGQAKRHQPTSAPPQAIQ